MDKPFQNVSEFNEEAGRFVARAGLTDNPEAREELEALARDKAYGKIRAKLKAELDRKRLDLERAATEEGKVNVATGVIAGEIKALRFAIGLPQQLYAGAGGKRVLFDPLAGEPGGEDAD